MEDILKGVLIDEKTLKNRIKELASEITRDYKDKKPVIVSLLKGAVPFMSELLKNLDFPLTIDFMDVSSFGGKTFSSGQVKILKDLDQPIEDRNVLIVEDIIDSGITLDKVIHLLKARGPESINICCMLSKTILRKKDIDVKYVGFEIPDEFVIGFGLDYQEMYRNLQFIGIVDTNKLNEGEKEYGAKEK